jgi:regulatory protein YycH of two-component signal transduction system YycFG
MIENIKTFVLWLLILLSVFLTYQIWTFQPEYAILKSAEYIDNLQIGEEKSLQEVIKPKHIVFHHQESSFSPSNQLEINDTLYEELFQGLTFENFSPLSNLELRDNRQSNTELEFIFPDSIPAEVIIELFQINSSEQFLLQGIDQVVFSTIEIGEEEQVRVRFVSLKEKLTSEAVTNLSVSRFEEAVTDSISELSYPVFSYVLINYGNGYMKKVYLPDDTLEMDSAIYLSKPIAPEHFKQSLFSDPSFVKNYLQSNGEESFTDGNRMVNVLNSGNVLRYINPGYGDTADRSSKSSLNSSLDFLNGHGGLTNPFYFDSVKSVATSEEITFRLAVGGHPVYESNFYDVNNLFEITLTRVGGNQFEQYIRPLFYIEADPINSVITTKLPSGHELIDLLKNQVGFDRYLLTDINNGFKMNKRQSIITFEPSWFIQYNGKWESISVAETDDSEVIFGGLE